MIYSLYMYTNKINGKRYIGVTHDLGRRCKQHANGKSRAQAFNSAMKKYGLEAFDFKVLAIFDRKDAAAYHEQAAILKFSLSPKGYNLRAGAPYTQYAGPCSDNHRSMMMGNQYGVGHQSFLGHHHSREARHKMVIAAKLRPPVSEETKKLLSKARTGNQNALGKHWSLSEKTKQNMSKAQIGNTNGHGRLGKHYPTQKEKK